MPPPHNRFKSAIIAGRPQIGLWMGMANPYTAEICAGAGFDWLVIDGEHGPNTIPLIAAQLQALAASGVSAVVRAPVGETWIIKQILDVGAQTIIVPMVETSGEAEALVKAANYPPRGIRGVGSAMARASAFNRIPDYLATANAEVCLIVQLESAAALKNLEAIAAVDGVDGVFIGPSDLAADMGFLGAPGRPEVQAAVEDGIARIIKAGKPAGILTADQALARRYLELGATFVAVGTDVTVFSSATSKLAQSFANVSPTTNDGAGY